MPDTIHLEWLNQNSLRNYPIRENAQRRPHIQDGTVLDDFVLPNYVITDFVMTVDSEQPLDLYLMKLALVGDSATFVIGSDSGVAASVYVEISNHTANNAYSFSGLNDYDDAKGCLVIGDLARLRDDLPDGIYNFDKEETLFESRCIRPSIKRVSSISIYDPITEYSSKKLRGNVRLVAGSNIIFKFDETRNAIVISAAKNEGYDEPCSCGADTTVKSINGISTEDVTLIGDDCVEVSTVGHTIRIKDKCSKPCCGCAEIDFINEKISQIVTAMNKLESYSSLLEMRLTEIQNSYVQGDQGARPG